MKSTSLWTKSSSISKLMTLLNGVMTWTTKSTWITGRHSQLLIKLMYCPPTVSSKCLMASQAKSVQAMDHKQSKKMKHIKRATIKSRITMISHSWADHNKATHHLSLLTLSSSSGLTKTCTLRATWNTNSVLKIIFTSMRTLMLRKRKNEIFKINKI